MNINIISWNTQGDGIKKISESCGVLFQSGIPSIFLIQEAGEVCKSYGTLFTTSFGRHEMNGYFVEQENVKNPRCTTGIFAEHSSLTGNFTKHEKIAKRPIVCLEFSTSSGSYVVATIHATADRPTATKELADAEQYLKQTYSAKNGWLLMGDFNCEPDDLTEAGIPGTNIAASGRATQKSGGNLDYAIFSNSLIGKVAVRFGVPGDPYFVPLSSDHYPVYCTLDL